MSAVAAVSTISARKTEITSIVNVRLMGITLDIYRVLRTYVKGGRKKMTLDKAKEEIPDFETYARYDGDLSKVARYIKNTKRGIRNDVG